MVSEYIFWQYTLKKICLVADGLLISWLSQISYKCIGESSIAPKTLILLNSAELLIFALKLRQII